MRLIRLLSYPQSGVNLTHIVNVLNDSKLVCNVISVLVEVMNFAMVDVENFSEYKLITVWLKPFDENYARIVVSKSEG